jgi:hypothetical protein
VLVVLGLLACGVVAGRTGALPEGTAGVLDRVLISLALPGLVLSRFSTIPLDATTLVPVAVAWTQLAVLVVLVLLAARIAGWSRSTTGTLLLCVPLGNTSFLGFPAVEALLGPDALPFAIVYDQLGTFLALATWGSFVAARWGAGPDPTTLAVLRRVVSFPPLIALAVALVGRTTGLPDTLLGVADALGATLTPLAMLSIGLRLRLPERTALGPLVTGLGLRMVLVPTVLVVLGIALDIDGRVWATTTLQSAMPPMITASVLATAAGMDERLATSLTGGGILLALGTLPLVAAVVGG